METASADIAARLESMRLQIRDVWSRSGLANVDFANQVKSAGYPATSIPIPVIDLAAMQIALLGCQPREPQAVRSRQRRRRDRGKGRPRKTDAAQAAAFIIMHFEEITRSKVDKPASERNAKPRGLEPLVRKIFDICGIDANAKRAIEAAREYVRYSTIIERPVSTAGEYFRASRH
jgi:hypothetical protein